MKQTPVQGHTLRLLNEARELGINSTRNQKTRTVSSCLINPEGLSPILMTNGSCKSMALNLSREGVGAPKQGIWPLKGFWSPLHHASTCYFGLAMCSGEGVSNRERKIMLLNHAVRPSQSVKLVLQRPFKEGVACTLGGAGTLITKPESSGVLKPTSQVALPGPPSLNMTPQYVPVHKQSMYSHNEQFSYETVNPRFMCGVIQGDFLDWLGFD